MTWTNFTRPSSFLSGGYFLLKGAGDLFKTHPFTDSPIMAVIILNKKYDSHSVCQVSCQW